MKVLAFGANVGILEYMISLYRLKHTVKLGLRSLAAHQLRSFLTILGIVLGVGSVIVMLAVGEAARYEALKQLEDLGANTIILRSVKPQDEADKKTNTDISAYGLTFPDLARIQSTIPSITSANPMREFRKTVRHLEKNLEARIVSITSDFLKQNNIKLSQGRNINEVDERTFANVAIIGSATAEKLFPTSDPIGRTISIDDLEGAKSFVIIGVTEPKILATGGQTGNSADFSRVVFIPFSSDRARFGRELISIKAGIQIEIMDMSQITVTVDSTDRVKATARVLESLIEAYHPNKDVQIAVPLDLLEKAEKTQQLFTLVLGAIAMISLVVGGIGIMNIMLATVTERTREVGVRRSLGAKRKDIALQFLVETLVLTCTGGLLGVGIGIGLTEIITEVFGLPTIIQLWSPLVAFGTSVLVGLVSGSYPARKAARLDPIEALRHE
ncbi:ABC transporter permease [Telmatocola sphagniphila]|jgi:putative ABC transport system permease protein|uniref:ABC transporter permease n=1 Tax=Telmatocola sphagniphila TaxID=1123043 RepID=A0A8E6B7H1_9BACT|nr:ABC transporter permease [Telmatocola sphagniphila]QVL31968.1 ABC transporter permease [Telmatocola sphagniphila]